MNFNASKRGINDLESMGILAKDEIGGAKDVLSAAATLIAISQLLRLIAISNRNRD